MARKNRNQAVQAEAAGSPAEAAEIDTQSYTRGEGPGDSQTSELDRQQRIALAAYYRAERRGFEPGFEEDDWYGAEAELNVGDAPRTRRLEEQE